MKYKTIYAVSTGSYSDYRVECLFELKEDANKFADELNALDDPYVEEFIIFEAGSEPEKVIEYRGIIVLNDDFSTGDPSYHSRETWIHSANVPIRPSVEYFRRPSKSGLLMVYGRTDVSVRKVISERVAAFKARSWIPQADHIDIS